MDRVPSDYLSVDLPHDFPCFSRAVMIGSFGMLHVHYRACGALNFSKRSLRLFSRQLENIWNSWVGCNGKCVIMECYSAAYYSNDGWDEVLKSLSIN